MTIADVEWARDRRGRAVPRLRLDGHLTRIPSGQSVELTRRGLVQGVDYLMSEWRMKRSVHPFIRRGVRPGLGEVDLAGCTDDPRVFALHEEMGRAITAGTWQPARRASED